MTVVKVEVDTNFFERLKSDLGIKEDYKTIGAALTILAWAVEERKQGRIILSICADGSDPARLTMRELEKIQPSK